MSDAPVTLTPADADRTLDELRAAHAQISTAMFAIDTHSGHELLRAGAPSGATGRAWDELRPAIEVLWAQFGSWRELLDRAEEVRARRERPQDADMAELEVLLCEPVVSLDHHGAPTSGADPTSRVTLAEFADRLQSSAASVVEGLDQVSTAQSSAVRRLAEAETTLVETRELAEVLDAGASPDSPGQRLDALAMQLAGLSSEALSDPLGVIADSRRGDQLDAVTAELRAVRGQLGEVERFRDEHAERLAALHDAVSELVDLEERASQVCQTATAKIASPGLPELRLASAELRRRVADLEQAVGARQWTRAEQLAAGLEQAVTQERTRTQELHQAAAGLLARREELRGRLRAYQVKAARIGVAEDPEVSARHSQAHDLLWTSPCDLRAATAAVHAFQELVARSTLDQRGNSR
ncbi:MAG: hypothetical protein GEU94_15075 [Micromonosporaceae bacterium]|nr:hypothetical protein [Micromonosporaceae bacterium]